MSIKHTYVRLPEVPYEALLVRAEDLLAHRISRTPGAGAGSDDGNVAFRGTDSLAAAVDLARRGWSEGAKRAAQGDSLAVGADPAPYWGPDVVGIIPIMGAYMAGDPEHMLAPSAGEREQQRIRLILPAAYPHNITVAQATQYAYAATGLVRQLEASGVSVAITLLRAVSRSGTVYVTQIALREYGDVLDIDRVAFALGHPSFLRRITFAWVETIPEYAPVAFGGYGVSYDVTYETLPALLDLQGETCVILPDIRSLAGTCSSPQDMLAKMVQEVHKITGESST